MIAKNEKPGWFFYLLWILLTLLCVPIAFFLDLVVLRIAILFVGDVIYVDGVGHITEDYLGMYTFIPIVGLLTGYSNMSCCAAICPIWAGGWQSQSEAGSWGCS